MSSFPSNFVERRNAFIRATILILLLMILTGFVVSRFQLVRTFQQQDCNQKIQSLTRVQQNYNSLLQSLTTISNQYRTIMQLDSIWESEKITSAKEEFEIQIRNKEKFMSDSINNLLNIQNDSVAYLVHKNLVICRQIIWNMRSSRPESSTSDECQKKLDRTTSVANSIANSLDREGDAIINASKKLFDKKILKDKGETLKKLAIELRGASFN